VDYDTVTPFARSFYEPSAAIVAPALLGHLLIRNTPDGPCGGVIVETEAYLVDDPACHAYVRQSPRNAAMWGPPGTSYVYLIYGLYHCFNAVCRPSGTAEAVLVRAIEPAVGEDWMQQRRPVANRRDLTNGPSKLCLAMNIDRSLDAVDLCDVASPLFIARHPEAERLRAEYGPLVTTTRIGITRAADWPLRFYLEGSPFVSKRAPRQKQSQKVAR